MLGGEAFDFQGFISSPRCGFGAGDWHSVILRLRYRVVFLGIFLGSALCLTILIRFPSTDGDKAAVQALAADMANRGNVGIRQLDEPEPLGQQARADEGATWLAKVAWLNDYTLGELLNRFAFSGDHKRMVIVAPKGSVYLWDLEFSSFVGRVDTGLTPVSCVALSPDGKKIGCANEDNQLLLLDIDYTSLVLDLSLDPQSPILGSHPGTITSLAFSADGNTLVSAGREGTIQVWDVATRRALESWPAGETNQPSLAHLAALLMIKIAGP